MNKIVEKTNSARPPTPKSEKTMLFQLYLFIWFNFFYQVQIAEDENLWEIIS